MTDSPILRLNGRYWRWYPSVDRQLGYAEDALDLPVDETVFLLIDVYGTRYDDDVEFGPEIAGIYKGPPDDPIKHTVRERIVPAKAAAKRAGLRRVYLTNYLSPGLSEGNEWRNMIMRTAGVDALQAWVPPTPVLEHARIIAPEPDEPLIRKQLYSGFFETHLDSVLRGYRSRNLVVVGFDSSFCLGATVVDAMYRDYRVIVLRDATRTLEYPETQEGEWANFIAIRHIEGHVGYTALTDDFISACDAVAAAGTTA